MLLKEFDSYQGVTDHAALNNLEIERCVVREKCDRPYLAFFRYTNPQDIAAHDAAVKRATEYDCEYTGPEELEAASEIYDQRFNNAEY